MRNDGCIGLSRGRIRVDKLTASLFAVIPNPAPLQDMLFRNTALNFRAWILVLLTASSAVAAGDSKLQQAWTDTSLSLMDEATSGFIQSAMNPAASREAVYGQALALLNTQPVTMGNINKSAELLQTVVSSNPSDDLGISAEYFLGRIEQVYRFEPDPAKAGRPLRKSATRTAPVPSQACFFESIRAQV